MAFSLEAVLVVPLVISSWIGLTVAAEPVYEQVRLAAGLEVQATTLNLHGECLYKADCLQDGPAWTTGLQTSPQEILELGSLIVDDCRLISRIFSNKSQPAGDDREDLQ